QAAIKRYDQAYTADTRDIRALEGEADAQLANGDQAKAISTYIRAARSYSGRCGNVSMALEIDLKVIALDPKTALFYQEAARTYGDLHNQQQEISFFSQAADRAKAAGNAPEEQAAHQEIGALQKNLDTITQTIAAIEALK